MTFNKRRLLTSSLLVLAGLLVFPALSLAAPAVSKRTRATQAYNRAEALRKKLSSTPEEERKISDYRVLILMYHSVYRLDPAYLKTPVSLEDIAELYREMGQVFSEERYFTEAIKSFEFVEREYPYSDMSREAPLNIGDVYLHDLHQPEDAQKSYKKYLGKFPRSERAADVKARLEQAKQAIAAKSAPPATVTRITTQSASSTGEVPRVTEIRHWVGPHYTRIVIGLNGGEIKFETIRLSNPDRIVLDLFDTRLSQQLAGMKFPVEDGFLRQVRVGQFKPDVTRIVLDVEKVEDYFVFPLPNPFRLVIDIHGPAQETQSKVQIAKSTPPEPPPAKASEASESKASSSPAKAAGETTSRVTPPTTASKSDPAPKAGTLASAKATEPAESAAETVFPIKTAAPNQSGSRTLTRVLGLKIGRIVIDPGHGGHDTGTIGPTGLREKDVVLDVALRLAKLLREEAGSEVMLTRSTDTFIPLEERTAIANEKGADLFVSIHANSSRDRRARGVETYYMNFTSDPGALEVAARENATSQESVHELRDLIKKIALTDKMEESHDFATLVQSELYKRLEKATGKQKNRGVKKAPFVVLIGANMPSVLAEISFLSNPSDEKLLKDNAYRQGIAESLYRATLDYVENLGGIKVAQRGESSGGP